MNAGFMKKIVFLLSGLVVSTLTAISCGDGGSPVKSTVGALDPCAGADESHLCAVVENSSQYNNVVEVKLMMFERYDTTVWPGGSLTITTPHIEVARGEWKNGGFTIELPKTLALNHFRPLVGQVGANQPTNINFAQSTINISNKNVRVADAHFVGVDNDGNEVAIFSPLRTIDNNYFTDVFFTFADSDVTISGHTKQEGHAMPACPECPSWFETNTVYSIEWKEGWNVWCTSTSFTTVDYTVIETKQWTISSESRLRWSGKDYNQPLP